MSDALFDELCGLGGVAPAIKRNDTNMRLAISVISTDIIFYFVVTLLHAHLLSNHHVVTSY